MTLVVPFGAWCVDLCDFGVLVGMSVDADVVVWREISRSPGK